MHLQLPKKTLFFILVYGRRSKMVNLCIVQFPGQSSNAIRVLLIFQPSTYFCFCQKKKFQLSSLSNMYVARCFQLIGKSQMESHKNFLCQRLTIDSMMTMIGAKSNFYCQMIHCALCASI